MSRGVDENTLRDLIKKRKIVPVMHEASILALDDGKYRTFII